MSFKFLWNIVTSPRTTILGVVGTTCGGAAFLYVMNAMHCDWTQLSMAVLTEAGAMLSAPAVVGAAMKDKPTVGDEEHEKTASVS
jgi:uncharacterized membrane protein